MVSRQGCFTRFALGLAVLAFSVAASADVVRIKSFGYPELSVWNPCGLIEGTDGLLYGASAHGGTVGFGSLFRINKDGGDLVVLHDFQSTNDGSWLTSRLLEATNGTLYGTTSQGGIANAGTIFRINKDGTEYEILHHFQTDTNGGYPQAALIQGQDGFLYGTTRFPGTVFRIGPDGNNYDVILRFAEVRPVVYPDVALLQTENGSLYGAAGRFLQFETTSVVFKVNPDGSGYQQLYEFDPAKNAGTGPSELVEGDDGRLYGTAGRGGNKGAGTIFSLNIDGTDFRVLHQFAGGGDGEGPSGRLIKGTNGLFYGITARGGSARKGTLFVFNPLRNSHKVLRSLGSLRNSGAYPAELVLDSQAPALYGVTGAGGSADDGVLFRFTLEGARYEKLVDFKNHGGDGSQPDTQLAQGPDGMLYGTTTFGGAPGFGTIFRLNTNGSSYQILWEFQGGRKSGNPVSVVVDPTNGALYGTTGEFSVGLLPNGTVFRLNTNGSYMPLHRFSGNDGSRPNALLQGSDGFLYGTTQYGGFGQAGVIFKLRNNGSKFQVLRLFSGRPDDGGYPSAALIEASDGALYGTTRSGGTNGAGTVFTINKSGDGFNLLHQFITGGGPTATLLEASDGKLYGTTLLDNASIFYPGVGAPVGSIFRLNKDGTGYEVLHNFSADTPQDICDPTGPLVEGPDGAIYGTARQGGEGLGGAVFKLNKDGSNFEVVQAFIDSSTWISALGLRPESGLFRYSDGALFGTTDTGGDCGDGTLFRIVPEP